MLARVLVRSAAPLAALALAFAVSGCSFLPSADLVATSWRGVTVDGQPIVAGHPPLLRFSEGRIGGSTGCNTFGGDVRIEGDRLVTSNVAMTLIGCEGPVGDQESKVVGALNAADLRAERTGDRLVLTGGGHRIELTQAADVQP